MHTNYFKSNHKKKKKTPLLAILCHVCRYRDISRRKKLCVTPQFFSFFFLSYVYCTYFFITSIFNPQSSFARPPSLPLLSSSPVGRPRRLVWASLSPPTDQTPSPYPPYQMHTKVSRTTHHTKSPKPSLHYGGAKPLSLSNTYYNRKICSRNL